MHNQVRIIGGQWRGRKLFFPNLPSIKPTPNRIKETLFNWLMPVINGATCLDMFAGSGSLSFEALSRGAKSVTLWESNPETIHILKENAQRLKAEHIDIKAIHFPNNLPKNTLTFDIIFLDPPFHQGYIQSACHWLAQSKYLKPSTLIYIEAESSLKLETVLPKGWVILKAKKAGNVCFFLVRASI